MNGGGSGQWFNDRRFNFNGPQRLRESVTQILNELNTQIVQDNPELLNQLAEQFQRLQQAMHGRRPPQQRQPVQNPVNEDRPSSSQNTTSPFSQITPTDAEIINRSPTSVSRTHSVDRNRNALNSTVVLNIELENVSGAGSNANNLNSAAENDDDEENPRAGADTTLEQEIETVRRSPEWQRLIEAGRNPDVQKCLKFVAAVLPFLLIIVLKLIFTHITGIFMLCTLMVVFFYAEKAVCRQVFAKVKDRSRLTLLWISFLLVVILAFFYYEYLDESLYLALIFQVPLNVDNNSKHSLSLTDVLWVVICTDFAAKYIVLIVKCWLAFIPSTILSFRRKSCWYQWTEFTSHLYRHWLPLPIWWCYLYASDAGNVEFVLSNILSFSYAVLKLSAFRSKFRSWFMSLKFLWRPVPFGCSPKTTDLITSGPTCSICYGDFLSPVQLLCKHIFCEECISTWLDKERTCPICRTQIGTEDRSWRDGSTSYSIQLC